MEEEQTSSECVTAALILLGDLSFPLLLCSEEKTRWTDSVLLASVKVTFSLFQFIHIPPSSVFIWTLCEIDFDGFFFFSLFFVFVFQQNCSLFSQEVKVWPAIWHVRSGSAYTHVGRLNVDTAHVGMLAYLTLVHHIFASGISKQFGDRIRLQVLQVQQVCQKEHAQGLELAFWNISIALWGFMSPPVSSSIKSNLI